MIGLAWWQAFVLVLLIAAFLAANGGAMIAWIGGWWRDGPWHFAATVAVTVLAISGWAGFIMAIDDSDQGDRSACEQAGGYWEQTGTRPVLVGKIIVMQPVYGCVFRAGR